MSTVVEAPSRPPVHQVEVATASSRYPITICAGLLGAASSWAGLPPARDAVIVSSPTVWPLYGAAVQRGLSAHFARVSYVLLPDGEAHKTWGSLELLFQHLLTLGCDRQTVLVALGGGVVGDMTGFAAATYMRGVPFVQVPTTLLAQVDSSVGGKTAINHPLGKNMIGAFYQPLRVLCDLDTLASLPAREYAAGLAEVVKYGPVADVAFLQWLEAHADALVAREPVALLHAVRRSCEIKAAVVGADERETGQRAILNFGHTFGHAIETGLGYGQWLHGEAVACGMVLATDLSQRVGQLAPSTLARVRTLLLRLGLPVQAPAMPWELWNSLMRVDKKANGGDMRFVLIGPLGQARMAVAPEHLVRAVIDSHSAAPPT